MSKGQPVSIRLEPGLDDQVAAIADKLERSKSWVIAQAVRDFVGAHAWQAAAIQEGILAAAEGRVAAHDDVVAWIRSWDHADELPMPDTNPC